MKESDKKEEAKKKVPEVKKFIAPFTAGEIQKNLTTNTHAPSTTSPKQLIIQALKFHSQGNILEAAKYYKNIISQGFKDPRVFSNYGVILKNLGKLKEAEIATRKAIELNPNYADAHSNLGIILKDLGKLKEAEIATRKAIELNPDFVNAHLNLGRTLRNKGDINQAMECSKTVMSIRPWSIIGSYSFNQKIKSNPSHD